MKLICKSLCVLAMTGLAFAQDDKGKKDDDKGKKEESSAIKDVKIALETSKGTIEATIFASKLPMTAANFLNLAKRHYYDGLTFHRVLADFMIQGGDPLGTGTGGPGYRFGDEFDKNLRHSKPGIFSMANAGPGTNGSQFFITHKETPWLDGKHSVFGEVTKGQNVVNAIAKGDKIKSIKITGSTVALFKAQAANLKKWNATLDEKFGDVLKEKAGEKK
jgi:peptidyl-prolyl cis-trans isomerase B (cyclophilin B)